MAWLLFSIAFAVLFALSGALSRANAGIGWFAGASFFLGAIVAPEFEPKAFRRPVLWQVGFAIAGFLLVALALNAPLEGYLLALVGGVVFGYVGPLVVKHM